MCLNFVECNNDIRLARCLVVSKRWLLRYDNLGIGAVRGTFYQSTRIQTNAAVHLLLRMKYEMTNKYWLQVKIKLLYWMWPSRRQLQRALGVFQFWHTCPMPHSQWSHAQAAGKLDKTNVVSAGEQNCAKSYHSMMF